VAVSPRLIKLRQLQQAGAQAHAGVNKEPRAMDNEQEPRAMDNEQAVYQDKLARKCTK